MFNTMDFWLYATYVAAAVAIVGPTIVLIAGLKSSYDIFFGGKKKK